MNNAFKISRKACPARAGMSLVEILMALFILTIAVLPAIGTFSGYYGVATRQMDQEMALKLGEGVINVLMTTTYSDLVLHKLTSLPLNIQTPSGTFVGTLNFSGDSATSSAIVIGKTSYTVGAEIKRVFEAQNIDTPHKNAMEFSWQLPDSVSASGAVIATYSCRDDLLCIKVSVSYGGQNQFKLATFRADMTR